MSYREITHTLGANSRRLTARLLPPAVILVYHRVSDAPLDPQLLCVSPANFADHLRVMRELGECVSLRDLVHGCRCGPFVKRGLAVTFDDGYADNLENAEPRLRSAGVPATVFITTGGLEAGTPFWWDELEALLLHPRDLPDELSINIGGRRLRWALRIKSDASSANARWDVTQPTDPTPRHAAYRSITRMCRAMMVDEREKLMDQLRGQLGGKASQATHDRLTPEQVVALAGSEIMDVGAHGVTHAPFSAMTSDEIRREMWASSTHLMKVVGSRIDLFSYPFGSRGDLTQDTARLAHECGFAAACANWPGAVWPWTDPNRLPRHLVRNWERPEFARRLTRWLHGDA